MPAPFDANAAASFANLALTCVNRQYPNKIAHTLNSDADVLSPRKLTPAFYGCYDWHSSVHGHWLLARLARMLPHAAFTPKALAALRQNLTAGNIAQEAAYMRGKGRASFERPYGWAWLLQLAAELRQWDHPQAQELAQNLGLLEATVLERVTLWLPKLPHPVRSGEHSQTAFALGLMLDYSRATDNTEYTNLFTEAARQFYLADRNCPLAYEPSGEDFLSPGLAEADVMRRVLTTSAFAEWLRGFMPQIRKDGNADWLRPAISPDPSDPKLAHLDGLNLSRAWMLEAIASALPPNDARLASILLAAESHASAGLASVTGEHYEGGHWLGSFAVYLVSKRGVSRASVGD